MIRSSIDARSLLAPRALLAAMLVVGVVAAPLQRALGQSAQADPKDMARSLGEEGLKLHAQGRFAEAYDEFATAENIQHSPVLVLWMARSRRGLGRLLEAARLYERVTAEQLAPDASPKWLNAQREADAELRELRVRTPTLEVRLARAWPAAAALTIDGAPASPGRAVQLDPGEHRVRAAAAGHPAVERGVHLDERQHETIEIAPSAGASETRGSALPGAVFLGIGVAAIAGGAITGAVALKLAGDVNAECVDHQCLAADEPKAHDATTLAGVSTALFIGSAVASAVGLTLLVVRPGGKRHEASRVSVGPGIVRAALAF